MYENSMSLLLLGKYLVFNCFCKALTNFSEKLSNLNYQGVRGTMTSPLKNLIMPHSTPNLSATEKLSHPVEDSPATINR